MKRARLLMLLLIALLVALPVAAGTLNVSNNLLMVEPIETKIALEEVSINYNVANEALVTSVADITLWPAIVIIMMITMVLFTGFINMIKDRNKYKNMGGVPMYSSGHT
jgi:hypothetical protein